MPDTPLPAQASRIGGRDGHAALSEPGAPSDTSDRPSLLARWTELTRRTLPAMAASQPWPIREDHCFMRVCLDAAVGSPWHLHVPRPAIRHLTDAQLAAAVRVAEGIAERPETLAPLNERSLRGRRAAAREG